MTTAKPRPPPAPGRPGPFRCCRCATSSYSRTWSWRSSSDAKSRSARSMRRSLGNIHHARDEKNASDDDPASQSHLRGGTLANVLRMLWFPDGTVKVLVEALSAQGCQRHIAARITRPRQPRSTTRWESGSRRRP